MTASVALAAALALAVPPAAATHPSDAEADALRALALASAGDPDVVELQAAAAREAERDAGDAGSIPRRARLSALLPRLSLEYRREEQSNRVVGLQGAGEVDYLRLTPGSAIVVRASWDLGGLVAAPGEAAAAAVATARARRRSEAVLHATALHYERRRLKAALLLDPPSDPLARATAELEIARLGAELDALTGGLLSGRAP
jgi:hypothetical protein